MKISVIIPAYNAALHIRRVLEAIELQVIDHDVEVIVVDDGSTDHTPHIVAQFPKVKLISQKNAGPATARNIGAGIASGDLLCFTDSDCIAHSDWISKLVRGFSHPHVDVVCGSYGIANPESILSRGIHAEIKYRHHFLMPDFPKVFGSYNFCIRKKLFDALGGFNTTYKSASGEDNDLSYRVIAANSRIYFERMALVDHYHTSRLWKYLKEQFRHGHWRMRMYVDHPQMLKGDNYTFWKDIIEVPLVFLSCLSALVAVLGFVSLKVVLIAIILPFLIFEIFFSKSILKNIFESFFYGIVMFFRSFARAFGLSTGIIYFLIEEIKKKFK